MTEFNEIHMLMNFIIQKLCQKLYKFLKKIQNLNEPDNEEKDLELILEKDDLKQLLLLLGIIGSKKIKT